MYPPLFLLDGGSPPPLLGQVPLEQTVPNSRPPRNSDHRGRIFVGPARGTDRSTNTARHSRAGPSPRPKVNRAFFTLTRGLGWARQGKLGLARHDMNVGMAREARGRVGPGSGPRRTWGMFGSGTIYVGTVTMQSDRRGVRKIIPSARLYKQMFN